MIPPKIIIHSRVDMETNYKLEETLTKLTPYSVNKSEFISIAVRQLMMVPDGKLEEIIMSTRKCNGDS